MSDGTRNCRTIPKFLVIIGVSSGLLLGAVYAQPASNDKAQYEQENQTSLAKTLAAWDRIAAVLQHPRCLNCHQQNVPLQGDTRRLHIPLVVRGTDDHGVGAMRCGNCHNEKENNEASGVPGAGGPGDWSLAPVSMLWQGLSSEDLCRMLKDSAGNGNRDGPKLIHHMETDPRVQWGWNPGSARTKVPIPRDEFIDQMKTWVAGGMVCPG
jgi:hypothetical protein